MKNLLRRHILRTTALAVTTLALGMGGVASAQDRTSVKIGYALSLTGPNAGGTGITTLPNYQLWVKEVNEAGGLEMPDGKRLPIEVVEYDDRSSAEELVRALQRLATQDEVDFILPPWSTGYNLAAAPLLDRYGYPHLAATSVTDKAPEFVQRWKKSFWMLGGGHDYTGALAKVLTDAADKGTINKKVAMKGAARRAG
ncbi:ABC transporter substrate-binding protein [Pseudorhizobium sp. NPDC055634]